MNRPIKRLKPIFRFVKALLGLPYVPMGILLMLAWSWFDSRPDIILTATLVLALPISWICRLQCEREQGFYKKLYLNSKKYLQTTNARITTTAQKKCYFCSRTVSFEANFCPYCGATLKQQNVTASSV